LARTGFREGRGANTEGQRARGAEGGRGRPAEGPGPRPAGGDRWRSTEGEDDPGSWRSDPVLTRRPGLDQLEGRNVVLEALLAGRTLRSLLLDQGAQPRGALQQILDLAAERGLSPERRPRQELDRLSLTGTHNGVMAFAEPRPELSLKQALDELIPRKADPFVLLLDQVQYEQNLGAILRTAEAAGVDLVVVPRSHAAPLSPVARRISAGASEHVPLVREATMSALKQFQRAGILIVGADEHSEITAQEARLTGPLALIMGGEHKGLSEPVRKRCDLLVKLPMRGRIPSLNVSVAAALLLYERVRQDGEAARLER